MEQSPLAAAVNSIMKGEENLSSLKIIENNALPYLAAPSRKSSVMMNRRRAISISRAWGELSDPPRPNQSKRNHYYIYAVIKARNPQTGKISEESLFVRADGYVLTSQQAKDDTKFHLEVRTYESPVNNLRWTLIQKFSNDRMACTSQLTHSRSEPLDYQDKFHLDWSPQVNEYEALVQKLAEGWDPVGYVSLNSGSSRFNTDVCPEPFDIDSRLSPTDIQRCIIRIKKIKLALSIEEKLGWDFVFTDAYFESELTLETIQSQFFELRVRLNDPSLSDEETPPVPTNTGSKHQLKLAGNRGAL